MKDSSSSMTNAQLQASIEKLTAENIALDARVTGFKTGGIELVSEGVIEETLKQQIFYANGWKKMKRGCKEMLDTISEAADMNPKEFIKKLGLETDEDYGVNLDDILIK